MSQRYPINGQPPAPPQAPVPASIRTQFLAGGGAWAVDEDVRTTETAFARCLAADPQTEEGRVVWLHADHREIAFSRALVETWVTAWTRNKDIEVVEEPDVVRHINQRR